MTEKIFALFPGRLQVSNPEDIPETVQWMPPGKRTITAHRADGSPITLDINVTAETAAEAIKGFQDLYTKYKAGGPRPFLDLNHNDAEASAYVEDLFWAGDDPKTGGIRARVEWTAAGTGAIQGKTYRQFSPTFGYEEKTGKFFANSINMGGLVNRPAFSDIQPFFAGPKKKNGGTKALMEVMSAESSKAFRDWLRDEKDYDDDDIEGLSEDKLADLYDEFQDSDSENEFKVKTENAEAAARYQKNYMNTINADATDDLNPDSNPLLNHFIDWLSVKKGFDEDAFKSLTDASVFEALFEEFSGTFDEDEGDDEDVEASEYIDAGKAKKCSPGKTMSPGGRCMPAGWSPRTKDKNQEKANRTQKNHLAGNHVTDESKRHYLNHYGQKSDWKNKNKLHEEFHSQVRLQKSFDDAHKSMIEKTKSENLKKLQESPKYQKSQERKRQKKLKEDADTWKSLHDFMQKTQMTPEEEAQRQKLRDEAHEQMIRHFLSSKAVRDASSVDTNPNGMSIKLIAALHAVSLVSDPDLDADEAAEEIRAGAVNFKIQEQELLAKIEALTAQVTEGKAIIAKLFVERAVTEGRIAAKDDAGKAYWIKLITNDVNQGDNLTRLPNRFDAVAQQITNANSPFAQLAAKAQGVTGITGELQSLVLHLQATDKLTPDAALVKAATLRPDLYEAYMRANK